MSIGRDEVGQRSETVRRANLSAIVSELHIRGALTRSDLVARTGLTRSAIRGLVGELSAAGLVTEERAIPVGTPGRPSPLVRLEANAAVVVALEIAVDSLAVAVVGLGGEVFYRSRIDRPRAHSSVSPIIADLRDLIAHATAQTGVGDELLGVGVAIVGVVRRTDGFVSLAPNLGWVDVPLGDLISRELGLAAPVSVANEADLGALAEYRRGAAVEADTVVFISGEVGVGGGIIVEGRPLTGVAGYGGEVGHMPVRPDGAACRCGSVGCWETEIGEGALLLRAGHPLDGGRPEVDAVLREAEAGGREALAALDHVGHWLGVGLAGLVNILNPGLVVVGGLFARVYPFVAATVERELDGRALRAPRAVVRVVPATLGVDAPLLGAAELAFGPLLQDPAQWLGVRVAPGAAMA